MPARIPLFFNTSSNRIEEVVPSDSLQLDLQTDIKTVTETLLGNMWTTLSVSSGTLTLPADIGSAWVGTLNAPVTTWAFTNVPTTNNKITTITVFLQGNTLYTYGDACTINGTSISGGIKWSGGTAPTSTNNIDVLSFIIIRDGNGIIIVIGSSTTNIS